MSAENSFVVSDQSKNSYGIRVITAGIKTDRFLKNPVMLNLHDRSVVLGAWENLRTEGEIMLADPIWDVDDPDAVKIQGKVKRGFIKGASIGIEPIKTTYNEETDTVDVLESILKEISIASVPSNENALRLFDKDGQLMNEEALMVFSTGFKNNFKSIDMKDLKVVAKLLNLADTATTDDVAVAVQELKDNNLTLTDDNAKLKTEVKKLKEAAAAFETEKVTNLVDNAIAAGKILAGEKEDYIALATTNYTTTKKLLDAKQARVSLADRVGAEGEKDAAAQFADETKGWDWDKFHKSNKAAELKLHDRARYDQLFEKKYGRKPNN